MESCAYDKVIEMTHELDRYFHTEKDIFQSNTGEPLEREWPCVTDINDFVNYIHEVKGLHFHDTILKNGMDGGGNFMKVCLLTMDKTLLSQGID